MESRVLEYGAKARPPGRRLATVAFLLSLAGTPPVMAVVVRLAANTIGRWFNTRHEAPVMFLIVVVPGALAAMLGAMSQHSGRRRLGVAAIVIGTLSAVANGVLLFLALKA